MTNPPRRPVFAISMGDPQGIGPEITVKSLYDNDLRSFGRYRIFGSDAVLRAAAVLAGIKPFWVCADPARASESSLAAADVVVFDTPTSASLLTKPGNAPGPTALGGQHSFQWVENAIRAASLPAGDPMRVDAIVTAPISKTSWDLAGHKDFPGHTELLAARLHAPRSGMLFVGPSLRVMLATIHISLESVPKVLTKEKVLEAIELADAACRGLGIPRPRIAVCGINPHAGEGGILGHDEARAVTPAISLAKSKGIAASGPYPGDTVFGAAAAAPRGQGLFDCVVAMYHDQGLIPVKLLDGKLAVNVTVGLPTIRTSPAHGTAFDIAGANRADPRSMRAAIELAGRMVAFQGAADASEPPAAPGQSHL